MEDNLRDALKEVDLFRGISEPARWALVISAQSRVYARGEKIIGEGQFGDKVFVVQRGSVEVVKGLLTTQPVVLTRLGENDVFGEMCLIEGVVRSASVVAAEASLVYSVHNAAIHKLRVFYPDDYGVVIQNVTRDLCRRLRNLDVAFAATSF